MEKRKKKAWEMSTGIRSDFEVIEGEGILTMRNKNQAKKGKS